MHFIVDEVRTGQLLLLLDLDYFGHMSAFSLRDQTQRYNFEVGTLHCQTLQRLRMHW